MLDALEHEQIQKGDVVVIDMRVQKVDPECLKCLLPTFSHRWCWTRQDVALITDGRFSGALTVSSSAM